MFTTASFISPSFGSGRCGVTFNPTINNLKNHSFSHPEIELRPSALNIQPRTSIASTTTTLDLLEVYSDHVNWKERLDHSSLLKYFRKTSDRESQPLRIFFVDEFNFVDPHRLMAEPSLELNTTAYWMHQRFGVSPLFFSLIFSPNYVVPPGNASLMRMENKECLAVDGFYRLNSMSLTRDGYITYVWFSHSLTDKSSTYVIHGCPEQVKDLIVAYAKDETISILLRPLAIDVFISEYALHAWSQAVVPRRDSLIGYEKGSVLNFSPEQTTRAVEELHQLSQNLHIIQGCLTDLQERIQYLLGVHQRLMHFSHNTDVSSVKDSLEYLSSKTSIMTRWVNNYTERTGIRINLFFNLATQADSRTNLEIARLSSRIAVSTQQDSSSMITVAALTMFFLPGTFVSAIFSMVFFDTKTSENGRESLIVGSQWWLFLAITIPLTILVFVIWVGWQRYHKRMDSQKLGTGELEDRITTGHL